MNCPLVPKLVKLNDLERRNGHYFASLHILQLTMSNLFKFYPNRLRKKCSPIVYRKCMNYGDIRRDYRKETYALLKASLVEAIIC